MAKLNVTADKIQLTTNMIKSTDPATSWDTDEKYPTALAVKNAIAASASAAVCDVANAVGSVVITSTNTNPGSTLGGTWELIDKEYKNEMLALTANVAAWTAGNAGLTSGYVIRANHSTRLKLVLTTTASLSAGASLGTISPATVGTGDIPLIAFGVSDLVDGIVQAVNKEGTKTYDIQYSINANGVFTITKIFNNETLPVGTVLNITTFIPMVQDFMADWACDKFYWKRTK